MTSKESSTETKIRLQALEDAQDELDRNQDKLERNYGTLMVKLDKLIIGVAELPAQLLEKTDPRYAQKSLETIVSNMEETVVTFKGIQRWVGWMSGIAVSLVGLFVGLGVYAFKVTATNVLSEAKDATRVMIDQSKKDTKEIIEQELKKKITELNLQYNLLNIIPKEK